MDKKKLFIRLTLLVIFIFILNFIASKLYWYSSLWWFDMPMHFLGGFWLGLAFLWLIPIDEPSLSKVFKIIIGVLIIGIFWELFEIGVNDILAKSPFDMVDTVSDLFFDISGGFASMIYFFTRIMRIVPNTL
ncbi:MAG: hypothetical protein AAB438_02730 [Patescibacteria group bacterium]